MPDRKTALLDSAERAARSRGFDGFSYADMARDVGIRTASIHYHFPSKADLSAALMSRYHESFAEICAQIDARHGTASARLIALIDCYRLAHGDAQRVCLCVAFSISRESLSTQVAGQLGAFRTMMRDWIEAVFRLAQTDGTIADVADPAAEAAATLALLEGAQLSARAENAPARFDDALRSMLSRAS
ncbi:TetR/AcrR family transcriptional regulator [Sulfitobacter albidus]|uniref:TetR/AcrR family transcriptional regulator n=1 Tax=Sulfitobacter albidus TaxID=2829501 RepID=A0A975PN25_9RHOB|nr:TetR/AcrR family transcriptional regulator [Sulfitobacter albidus]QUJ77016.1 TetR/AcrR family transcriptional regulator [Sulfitobacter albidus]